MPAWRKIRPAGERKNFAAGDDAGTLKTDHFRDRAESMHLQLLRDALATDFDFALVFPGRRKVVSKLHP